MLPPRNLTNIVACVGASVLSGLLGRRLDPSAIGSAHGSNVFSNAERDAMFTHAGLAKLALPVLEPLGIGSSMRMWQKLLLWSGCTAIACSASFSLLFPIANFVMAPTTQTPLQQLCLCGIVGCLVAIAPLVPALVQYVQFLLETAFVSDCGLQSLEYPYNDNYDKTATKWVCQVIARYHHPTIACVLGAVVRPGLIPRDVSCVVASFLEKADLHCNDMTIAECAACREDD